MSEDVPLPEIGELVIATVTRITPYGAYATLDEYNNIEGLLHISEVSSHWVKNIKEHVREGQKTVLKVLRVDPGKTHVDLSLRRVNEREKKEKLLQWKQESRGRKLLDIAAEKMNVTSEEAYEKIGKVIEDNFENIYSCLEKTVEKGDTVLTKYGIPADWANVLTELARMKIKVPKIKIRATLELTTTKPDGVKVLRNIFSKTKNVQKPEESSIKIFTSSAPKYRIEVTSESYKEAENLLERASQTALKAIKAEGGEGKFIRKTGKEA